MTEGINAEAILNEMKPEELMGVIERLKNQKDEELKRSAEEKAALQAKLEQEKIALQSQLEEQTKKAADAESLVQNLSKHGIDTSKLPAIADIADVLEENPMFLQNLFNKNPKRAVELVEMKVGMRVDMLDRELKDAGIDISGAGVAANFHSMMEMKTKYPSALHVDEDFPKEYEGLMDKLEKTYVHTEKIFDVVAKIANLQDCARSITVHYLLLITGKDKDMDEVIPPADTQVAVAQAQTARLEEIMKAVEEMKRENSDLRARLDEKDSAASEKERAEITEMANEELKKVGEEEEARREAPEPEEEGSEEGEVKKKGRRRY